ncbi:MAG: hypothetical protein ACRC20_01875 [Segniliparus sp.]|uniref:hypothetical protein n=1 Tax=Segniliparus sp. TaxID=2804064 RepID=UPI003F349B96
MTYRTTMWEAVAVPGGLPGLVGWAADTAVPALLAADPCCQVQLYHSADDRLVIIATGGQTAPQVPAAPDELCERPPHQWRFQPLGNRIGQRLRHTDQEEGARDGE